MTLSVLWQILSWGWLASEVVLGVATRTKRAPCATRDRWSFCGL
jgi:hypothetical protein